MAVGLSSTVPRFKSQSLLADQGVADCEALRADTQPCGSQSLLADQGVADKHFTTYSYYSDLDTSQSLLADQGVADRRRGLWPATPLRRRNPSLLIRASPT